MSKLIFQKHLSGDLLEMFIEMQPRMPNGSLEPFKPELEACLTALQHSIVAEMRLINNHAFRREVRRLLPKNALCGKAEKACWESMVRNHWIGGRTHEFIAEVLGMIRRAKGASLEQSKIAHIVQRTLTQSELKSHNDLWRLLSVEEARVFCEYFPRDEGNALLYIRARSIHHNKK